MATAPEIRDKVKALLEGWVGLGANIRRDQYKSQFFPLCREAQGAGSSLDRRAGE